MSIIVTPSSKIVCLSSYLSSSDRMLECHHTHFNEKANVTCFDRLFLVLNVQQRGSAAKVH